MKGLIAALLLLLYVLHASSLESGSGNATESGSGNASGSGSASASGAVQSPCSGERHGEVGLE